MRPRWYHDSRTERVLAGRYPFGIARRILNLSQKKSLSESLSAPVLFVASYADSLESGVVTSFAGLQGELLAKAISQGLKWSLDTTKLIFAFPKPQDLSDELSEQALRDAQSALQVAIKKLSPRVIVALGHAAAQALGISQPDKLEDRWVNVADSEVLCSRDLRDVLQDADIKKAFWQDLKFLASKLN